jgi:hypothetical protein
LGALLVLQFCFMRHPRFGTPLWPFLALAAASGGVRISKGRPAVAAVLSILLVAAASFGLGSLTRAALPRVAAIANPDAFRARAWPDQMALRELVAEARPSVAISMGAALWMPRPVYNLHWERNGEFFFRGTNPDRIRHILTERGVRSLVLPVDVPLPADGRIGHPTVDAWLQRGQARVRTDVTPRVKRAGRVWILVDLE